MKNVHGLVCPGLVINLIVVAIWLSILTESYMDPIELVFSLLFLGAILLQVIGLVMLIRGNRAGCTIGAIGAFLFVPIGLICAFGFICSRNLIDQHAYEIKPSGTLPDCSPPVADRLDTSMVIPGTDDPVSDSESIQTDQPPSAARRLDTAVLTTGADSPASDSESVETETALACYTFENGAKIGYLFIVLGIGGTVLINSTTGGSSWGLLTLAVVGGVLVFAYNRAAKLPVFALYDDYLEFTPNLYASPLHIPYTEIITVDMERKDRATMEVRRPDGSIDKKVRVVFNLIRSDERDQAREQFRRKMEELGILDGATATDQPCEETPSVH